MPNLAALGHGGLDALKALFHQVEAVIHGVETFIHRSEPAINRFKTPVEILVQLGSLGFVIHMYSQYAPGHHDGQVTETPTTQGNERNH